MKILFAHTDDLKKPIGNYRLTDPSAASWSGTLGIHAGVYFGGEYTVEDIMLRGDRLPEHPDDETDLTAERVERCIWLSTIPVLLLNRL